MNKKAFLAILIALIIPVIIFLYVNALPKASIPKPIFYDSVATHISKGKQVNDTFWHHLPNFTMTNQLGKKVSFSDISLSDSGRISVIDFFFTRCNSICPGMTAEMKRLQKVVTKGLREGDNTADYVQYISFTIDPEHDSVPQLKKWADKFQIDPANWWLLTGDKQAIYDLSNKDMKLSVLDPNVDTVFPHSDIFVLVDKHGVVRARRDEFGNPLMYHSRDSVSVANLAEDIVLLSLEKDKTQPGPLAGEFKLILVVMVITVMVLVAAYFLFVKKKKYVTGRLEK